MAFDRRQIMGLGAVGALGAMSTGLGMDATSAPAAAATAMTGQNWLSPATTTATPFNQTVIDAAELDIQPDQGRELSREFQRAIEMAATARQPLALRAGIYHLADIDLPSGAHLIGIPGATILRLAGGRRLFHCADCSNIRLGGLVLDGLTHLLDNTKDGGLFTASNCRALVLDDVIIRNAQANGLSLRKCAGRVANCLFNRIMNTGIFSIDAFGLELSHNKITDCGNNGIQVWRSTKGEDGTIITGNRITHIRTDAGGSGQNGNGINIFRAGSVTVTGNHITDCAYSAVRANSSTNITIASNQCKRLGEVALYCEFEFDGALIANNLIDGAATGIATTNFNKTGRLAVIQGNLVRNLSRREFEPQDKRGNGIAVEADALVAGNVIEGAATTGIVVGWGRFMRDVTVTSNLIRNTGLGIGITDHRQAGTCLIAQNMISGARDGAIRRMNYASPIGADLLGRTTRDTESASANPANIHLMGNVVS